MRLALLALAGLTLLRFVVASRVPLAPDEAYYFLWSQHLQAGYLDHPPMVAYWIRAGTMLLGNSPLGIRLLGPIAAALGSLLVWDAGEQLFPHRQAGLIAAALLNATLMVGTGAILITPDAPLLFFWTASLAALARLITSGNPRWWLAVGLAAGLALLSKYTAVLFIAAVFIWLLTSPEGRATLRTPWPWAAVLLAGLIFAPDIAWNASHHWASFRKQGGREFIFPASQPAGNGLVVPSVPQPYSPPKPSPPSVIPRPVQFFGEFWAGQFGLFTPIIFVLTGCGLWRLRLSAAPAAPLLVWVTLVPGVVFLEHVISDRVQPNWLAVLYPSACLATAALPAATLRRWLKPALATGFFLTAIAYAQALTHFLPLPPRSDPSALASAGGRPRRRRRRSHAPARLHHLGRLRIRRRPCLSRTGQRAHRWPEPGPLELFAFPAANLQNKTGLFISRYQPPDCMTPPQILTRRLGPKIIATYHACFVTAVIPGALLPRP